MTSLFLLLLAAYTTKIGYTAIVMSSTPPTGVQIVNEKSVQNDSSGTDDNDNNEDDKNGVPMVARSQRLVFPFL